MTVTILVFVPSAETTPLKVGNPLVLCPCLVVTVNVTTDAGVQ